MKPYFLWINFFLSLSSFSQVIHHESFSSNGGVNQLSNGFKVNHTFGQQSVIGNFSSGAFKISQGFQQSMWARKISEQQLNPEILMSLYPNPVEDELNFVFSQGDLGDISIKVFDISGRLILNKSFNPIGNRLKVDLQKLSIGPHLVQLSNSKFKLYSKIIKK
jgi:hypothetical protein